MTRKCKMDPALWMKGAKGHAIKFADIIRSEIDEPKIGCEVGVWDGAMSIPLLRMFPKLKLLMVDRYREYEKGAAVFSLGKVDQPTMDEVAKQVIAVSGFAADRRIVAVGDSTSVASMLGDGVLDFLFLDAGHDYESIKRDLQAWRRVIRIGGLMAGHDYGGKGDRLKVFGVKRAVDEFFKEKGGVKVNKANRIWWHRRTNDD